MQLSNLYTSPPIAFRFSAPGRWMPNISSSYRHSSRTLLKFRNWDATVAFEIPERNLKWSYPTLRSFSFPFCKTKRKNYRVRQQSAFFVVCSNTSFAGILSFEMIGRAISTATWQYSASTSAALIPDRELKMLIWKCLIASTYNLSPFPFCVCVFRNGGGRPTMESGHAVLL